MEALTLTGEGQTDARLSDGEEALLYCAEGCCAIVCKGEQLFIKKGESLLIRYPDGACFSLISADPCRAMLCRMRRI